MTYRILTVCTGNICRSPMAEVVLRAHAEQRGVDLTVDSAATTSYEVGNPIDPRAQWVLREAGYAVPRRGARQINADDIAAFDLILPMTREHADSVARIAQSVPQEDRAEIRLWTEFCDDGGPVPGADVPDPWYGGAGDFVETLDTLESAADNIVTCAARAQAPQ